MSVRDYSATPASNTAISGTDISEGCSPAGINNAIRQQMADIKDVSTGAVALESPAVDQLNFADNATAIFGSGGDLSVYHDGSNSYVSEQGTGNLNVLGTSIEFLNSAANKYYLAMTDGGSLTAYHNGSAKVSTTATGCSITGVLTADGVTVTGTNADLVLGTSGSNVTFNRNGDNYISASGGASSNIILDPQNRLAVNTGGSERLRVDSSGSIFIGSTSFSENGSTNSIKITPHEILTGTTTTVANTHLGFSNPNGRVGSITTSGSSTSYNTSSDYRLKTAVTYDWDATTRLKQLKPARFAWIADGDDAVPVDGFLAHEVQAVVPEAITGTKDEVEVWKDGDELPDGVSVGDNKLDENGDTIPVMQGIDQSKIVPLLVKTIIELEARIAALEA